MSKKIILFFIGTIYISSYQLAFAGLIINEVLYSPTAKQWVEIYNDSDSGIDLTKYKILDSGAAVNGHGITSISGSSTVEPHGFAVVAKVPEDFNGSSFAVFKSALGIKSSGDTVILRDPTNTVPDDTVAVSNDSAINGNSLQLIDGSWSGNIPTPGEANAISAVDSGDTDDIDDDTNDDLNNNSGTTTSSSSSNSGGSSSKKVVETEAPKISAKITVPKMIFIGVPFEIKGEAFSGAGKQLKRGRYFWNFGDGNTKEITEAENFLYTYTYEGDYIVTLEYYAKNSSKAPDAIAKIALKAVPMSVSISKVGDGEDFFIELANNTSYQMDISGWILASADKTFVLPRSSNILSKKKVVLSSKVTNFSVEDKNTLKLLTPEKEIVFDYGASVAPVAFAANIIVPEIVPVQVSPPNFTKKENPVRSVVEDEIPAENFLATPPPDGLIQIPVENLQASVIQSDIIKDSSGNMDKAIISLISIIFVGVSASAVYFIRSGRKKSGFSLGDDFEILDK